MTIALDRHIEITPGVRGGKPRIAGTRICVSDVVIMHLHLGQSVDEIVADYNLSHADVHAALAFYFDNKDAIDRRMAEDDAAAESLRQEAIDSPLHQKLIKAKAERGG